MKYLRKSTKILLVVLFIFTLVFGRGFYILFFSFLSYIVLYINVIKRVDSSVSFEVSTHTLNLSGTFALNCKFEIIGLLPLKLNFSLMLPHYIVENIVHKRNVYFAKRISIDENILCKGNRRGTYEVGEVEFRITDPLSFLLRIETISKPQTIFVFPNIIPLENLGIMITDPIEGIKAKYRLNFDYSYVAGVRDYTTQDSTSMIHWKQTAHRGKLSVKEFDFSCSKRIFVALNFFNKSLKFQDYASSVAASIIYYAYGFHLPFSVIINAKPLKVSQVKSNEYHLYECLKLLSTQFDGGYESSEFLKELSSKVDFGSELFYLDQKINKELLLNFMQMKYLFSKINIVLLVDEIFVLPNEKPQNYYFKKPSFVNEILKLKEVVEKENIFIYPIFGKDYLNILEQKV
ncbi:MAG: DUF58 domain-containing protein [Candidatus Atribacteria bacterium]|nr:DUF58 domain-containing protein [Candidatus Atribacteria bacterium]